MKRKLLSFFIAFSLLLGTGAINACAEELQVTHYFSTLPATYSQVSNNQKIYVYNDFLEKDIPYVKWGDEWAAVIDTTEDLEKYLSATNAAIENTISNAYMNATLDTINNSTILASSSSYTNNVLVRRVSGTFNYDCRCTYRVYGNKVVEASAYGELTGITWGVRYDESTHLATIINDGKAIDCFISGTITNYIFFKGIGDVYTSPVTSGGTVYISH